MATVNESAATAAAAAAAAAAAPHLPTAAFFTRPAPAPSGGPGGARRRTRRRGGGGAAHGGAAHGGAWDEATLEALARSLFPHLHQLAIPLLQAGQVAVFQLAGVAELLLRFVPLLAAAAQPGSAALGPGPALLPDPAATALLLLQLYDQQFGEGAGSGPVAAPAAVGPEAAAPAAPPALHDGAQVTVTGRFILARKPLPPPLPASTSAMASSSSAPPLGFGTTAPFKMPLPASTSGHDVLEWGLAQLQPGALLDVRSITVEPHTFLVLLDGDGTRLSHVQWPTGEPLTLADYCASGKGAGALEVCICFAEHADLVVEAGALGRATSNGMKGGP